VAEMDNLIDALGALPGVERTTSSIVLSTKIDR
jgi:endonuclease III